MKSALKLKRNTLYKTTASCGYFPEGTIVKRCKWVLGGDGTRISVTNNDKCSVAFRKRGSRSVGEFAYLCAYEVEEVI